MKKFVLNFGFVLTQLLLVVSCEQLDVDQETLKNSAMEDSTMVDDWTLMDEGAWAFYSGDVMFDICGEGDTYPFFESAMVTISNDENCIYVKVAAEEGWKVKRLAFNAWPVGSSEINYDYENFPYQMWFDSDEMTDTVTFKVCDQWEDIECLIFNIKVFTSMAGTYDYYWVTTDNIQDYSNIEGNTFIEYCHNDCGCYPYRTQTPGGWGAPAAGDNAGTYRDVNFDGAFPEGLLVGMESDGYSILLTGPDAMENLLPSGGKPAALTMDYENPSAKDLRNSFASQVIALMLSVRFDAYDEDFSPANANLGDLTFKEGSGFDGLTVQDILDEANQVLGGGTVDYPLDELHTIVTKVNEYYVDGKWTGDGMLFDDCWNYADN